MVPEQMAIFSINDLNIAKYMSPPLTTIHIDIPCICETALDLLKESGAVWGQSDEIGFCEWNSDFSKELLE